MDVFGSLAPALVAHGGIMPARGVDIGMSQRVRDQINILGFVIQPRSVGASQLMGAHALFERDSDGTVLFDHELDGALRDAAALQGKKKRVFIRLDGRPDLLSFLQIGLEGCRQPPADNRE